jgi:hypothetical protein
MVPKSVKGTIRKRGIKVVRQTPPVSCSGVITFVFAVLIKRTFDKMIYIDQIKPAKSDKRSPLKVSQDAKVTPPLVSISAVPIMPSPTATPSFQVTFSLRNITEPAATKIIYKFMKRAAFVAVVQVCAIYCIMKAVAFRSPKNQTALLNNGRLISMPKAVIMMSAMGAAIMNLRNKNKTGFPSVTPYAMTGKDEPQNRLDSKVAATARPFTSMVAESGGPIIYFSVLREKDHLNKNY